MAEGTPSATENGIRAYSQLKVQLETATRFLETRRPEKLFTLGGDCSVELAPISYLNTRYEDLTVVWFDAHADLQRPETSPSGDLHGMPLRLLLGEGDEALKRFLPSFLKPEQVVFAGMRALDAAEREVVSRWRLKQLSAAQINDNPKVVTRTLRSVGAQRVYLHVDFDVLDPETFTSLGWPEPGGISPASPERALGAVHQEVMVVGGGLMEYLPNRPEDKRTARRVLDAWLP